MPIYDYALLALLTSGAHAPATVTLTLGPDAIGQPNGGVVLAADRTNHNSTQDSASKPVKTYTAADKAKAGTTKAGSGFIKFDGVDGEAKDKDHKSWD